MCEAIFITPGGVTKVQFRSLDEVANAAQGIKDLLHYRCFEVYGRKREKKKKEE